MVVAREHQFRVGILRILARGTRRPVSGEERQAVVLSLGRVAGMQDIIDLAGLKPCKFVHLLQVIGYPLILNVRSDLGVTAGLERIRLDRETRVVNGTV